MKIYRENLLLFLKDNRNLYKMNYSTIEDVYNSKRNKYFYYNNYILLKKLISEVSLIALPVYKNIKDNPESNSRLYRFVVWIQRLNLLESELIYRDSSRFLKEIKGNSAYALKDYKDVLIGQTINMNQKSSQLIRNAEIKYKGVDISEEYKWEFNRIFLLYNISMYKLYMLGQLVVVNDIEISSILKNLIGLEDSVRNLYRNRYTVWKAEKEKFEIPEHLRYEPRFNKELDSEDYLRPIEYLFSQGYYTINNISDRLLMDLYKLDGLYLVKDMYNLNERLNKILEEK